MNGILIIACGNPIYGNMAFNLAMSIKHSNNAHITCLYSEQSLSELSDLQLSYFDDIKEVPEHYYQKGYQRIKCYANELTPYENTILIDADTVWNNKPVDLWGAKFQTGCLGKWENGEETHTGYVYWENPTKIVEYWGLTKLYKTYSGIVIWNKDSEEIWKQVQKVYDDDNAPCEKWGGYKPDEYAFNVGISLAKHDMNYSYMPVFFGYSGGKYTEHLMKTKYNGFSVAGSRPDPYLRTVYNNVMKLYSHRIGVPYKPYIDKGTVLAERAVK